MPALQKLVRMGDTSLPIAKASSERVFLSFVKKLADDKDNTAVKSKLNGKKVYAAYKAARKKLDSDDKVKQVTLTRSAGKIYFFFSTNKVTQKNVSPSDGVVFAVKNGAVKKVESPKVPKLKRSSGRRSVVKPPTRLPKNFRKALVDRIEEMEAEINPLYQLVRNAQPRDPEFEDMDTAEQNLPMWKRRLGGLRKRFVQKDIQDTEVDDRLRALRTKILDFPQAITNARRFAELRAENQLDEDGIDTDFIDNEIDLNALLNQDPNQLQGIISHQENNRQHDIARQLREQVGEVDPNNHNSRFEDEEYDEDSDEESSDWDEESDEDSDEDGEDNE